MVRPSQLSHSLPSSPSRQQVPTALTVQLKTLLAKERRTQLWRWGGGLGVLFFGLFFFFLYHHYQTASVLKLLHDGILALHNGKLEDATTLLERVNAQIGSDTTAQGKLARLYLAESYLRSGKSEEAKKLLEIKKYREEDAAYISQMLLLIAGRNAENQNDLQVARKAYDEAATLEGPFVGEILLSLARVAEASEDSTAAHAAREKFLIDFPNSPFTNIVQERLGK